MDNKKDATLLVGNQKRATEQKKVRRKKERKKEGKKERKKGNKQARLSRKRGKGDEVHCIEYGRRWEGRKKDMQKKVTKK